MDEKVRLITNSYPTYMVDGAIKKSEDEVCKDCISREEALKHTHIEYNDDGIGHRVVYAEDIEELPSVTPKPKSGKWIDIGATHSQCDKCLAVFEIVSVNGEANYCPNCGADMRGDT